MSETRRLSKTGRTLSEVVQETVESVRPVFDERRVSLIYQPPADAIVAEVDRGHVGRAVANLIDNALKFTPPQGRVTVELRRVEAEALISVSDTATGHPQRGARARVRALLPGAERP